MQIKKVVIPVAGKGTRFLPATKEIPKEMIPIIDRPMIHYAVEEAVRSGITEVIFIISKGKESILNYFSPNQILEEFLLKNKKNKEYDKIKEIGSMITFKTVEQKEQLGLGHAVLCAKELVGDDDFAVILGDDLILGGNPVTKQLLEVSSELKNSTVIGVMEVPNEKTNLYGIIDGKKVEKGPKNTFKMDAMIEKPDPCDAPTNLATPGRYVFSNRIFECLKEIPRGKGGEYQLTDAINLLAKKEDVFAHVFEGDRFDTGNIPSYLDATIEFALRNERTKKIMEDILVEKVQKYGLSKN